MSFIKGNKRGKLIISDESIDILMDAFQNKGEEMPKNISWNFIATVLLAGSYYEVKTKSLNSPFVFTYFFY